MIEIIEDIYGDGIGYVALLDTMGDSFTPAEDARTSTGKGRLGPEKDAKLQARLLADNHTSPFEGVLAKFEICAPLFVVRELDRHRTVDKSGEELVTPEEASRKWFARNEMSGRYIQMPDEYFHPTNVRMQSKTNVQGEATSPTVSSDTAEEFVRRGRELTREARSLYDWAINKGIERGQARIYNLQNQYTRIRYTASIKNWCDFLKLRLPSNVLWECRIIAQMIEQILQKNFPEIIDHWREYVRDSVTLSSSERQVLLRLFQIASYDRLDLDDVLLQKIISRMSSS